MEDNNKKDNHRKNLDKDSKRKFKDDDQQLIRQSKKAFKLKKRSLIEDELLDELEDYPY